MYNTYGVLDKSILLEKCFKINSICKREVKKKLNEKKVLSASVSTWGKVECLFEATFV